MNIIFRIIKNAIKLAKEQAFEDREKNEKRRIAKVFNDRYTYRREYVKDADRLTKGTAMYGIMPSSGYAWMCPECNKIHHPVKCDSLTGLQYPDCCTGHSGYSGHASHRLYENIKTSHDTK